MFNQHSKQADFSIHFVVILFPKTQNKKGSAWPHLILDQQYAWMRIASYSNSIAKYLASYVAIAYLLVDWQDDNPHTFYDETYRLTPAQL